jgi:hypothetical protein
LPFPNAEDRRSGNPGAWLMAIAKRRALLAMLDFA